MVQIFGNTGKIVKILHIFNSLPQFVAPLKDVYTICSVISLKISQLRKFILKKVLTFGGSP